jgi:osmotically-inducible protein OsmY
MARQGNGGRGGTGTTSMGWRSDQQGGSGRGGGQLQRRGGGGIAGRDFTGSGPRNYQRSPELIGDEVVLVLTADPDVDASDITVIVGDDGIVTLIGTVDDDDQSGRAEDLTGGVPGVSRVQNQLNAGGGRGGSGGRQTGDTGAGRSGSTYAGSR